MLSYQIMALGPQNKLTWTHISDITNLQLKGEWRLSWDYKAKSFYRYITENMHTLVLSFWTPDGAINILFLWNKQAEEKVILFM